MRSKEKQLDAVVTSINDNTQRNIEGITRDTIAQNKEDLITAQTTQNFMNQQANDFAIISFSILSKSVSFVL